MMGYSLNTERGFSFTELLASIAISGIVLTAVTTTFISQSKSYDAQEQINEMHQRARAAMDIMTREIRMAGYNPTGANFQAINQPSTDQVHVKADINGDGDTGDANEFIFYKHNSGQKRIDRKDGDGEYVTFVDDIEDLIFDALDSNGNSTTTPSEIRQIKITVIARTAGVDPNYPANGGYRTYTLTSVITPRNL